ncbi:hypothetical protein EON65_13280 [archaeon]|nr:MAG: hypothetical protein EON65_13280 [archaeon]
MNTYSTIPIHIQLNIHIPILMYIHVSTYTHTYTYTCTPLESPAGLIFPRVANPHPMSCLDSSLFHAYRRHILKSFNLLDVPPPAQPTIVLILRRRTKQVRVIDIYLYYL